MSFHTAITGETGLCPPALGQSRLYRKVLEAMGRETCVLQLEDYGAALLILRNLGPLGRVALMPGGPLWRQRVSLTERRDALRALPRQLRTERIGALITNCASPLEEKVLRAAGHLPLMTGGFEARLDLTMPESSRRARLKGKWRNRLVKAEAEGLQVERTGFSARRHGWLLQDEAAQRRARGYRGLPLSFTAAAAEQAPDQVQLFVASLGRDRLAAMLFLIHDGAASYHIGHVTAPGRAVAAHNLILWRAANWLAARGVARLDLGPVETEREAGLARFKLGCGAEPVARGASCLYTRTTAPLGRAVARLSCTSPRGSATRNGRSCR